MPGDPGSSVPCVTALRQSWAQFESNCEARFCHSWAQATRICHSWAQATWICHSWAQATQICHSWAQLGTGGKQLGHSWGPNGPIVCTVDTVLIIYVGAPRPTRSSRTSASASPTTIRRRLLRSPPRRSPPPRARRSAETATTRRHRCGARTSTAHTVIKYTLLKEGGLQPGTIPRQNFCGSRVV